MRERARRIVMRSASRAVNECSRARERAARARACGEERAERRREGERESRILDRPMARQVEEARSQC